MKKIILFTVIIFSNVSFWGCNSQGQSSQSQNFIEGVDYTVLNRVRITDQAVFQQPVEAFSLLLPENWESQGEIVWTMPGQACAGTNLWFRSESPNGKYSFQLFPAVNWSYSSDPNFNQMIQSQSTAWCGFGPPLDAGNYVRNVFLPQEANQPEVISIETNDAGKRSGAEKFEKYRSELAAYGANNLNIESSAVTARLKWNAEKEGIALCGIINTQYLNPNPYTGSYTQNQMSASFMKVLFTFPAADREYAEKLFAVIMDSYRTNESWQNTVDYFWTQSRIQSQYASWQNIRMMDEYTRQIGRNTIRRGEENLRRMDINMREWETSQRAQDRSHRNFINAIREVDNFRDATGTYEMSSSYNHAWSRNDGGSFIMTDNPNLDPSSIYQDQQWQRMERIK